MDAFIVGAERIDGVKNGAVYRVPLAPWRFVFHTTNIGPVGTTNAWSRSRCRDFAAGHQNPPHLWAAYHHDWVGQTVPLDRSAYALRHEPGDPETNHAHAIQVEVFGYAERGLTDPGLCDWLGRRLLGPVIAAGVPIDLTNLAPSDGPDAYGANGSVRQSWAWWAAFDGVCGHQNVPGNVHWDPGRSDYARIARAAQPPEPEPAPTTGDDGMFAYDRTHGASKVLVIVCSGKQTRVIGATVGGKVRNAGYYIGHVDDQMADWIDANYGPIEGL